MKHLCYYLTILVIALCVNCLGQSSTAGSVFHYGGHPLDERCREGGQVRAPRPALFHDDDPLRRDSGIGSTHSPQRRSADYPLLRHSRQLGLFLGSGVARRSLPAEVLQGDAAGHAVRLLQRLVGGHAALHDAVY